MDANWNERTKSNDPVQEHKMHRLQFLKRVVKTMMGRDFFPQIDGNYRSQRFGSQYGGWNVIVDLLTPSSIVYSFGIGEDATFDVEQIKQLGVTVHAFDPTSKSIEWVHKQNFPSDFVLHEFGLTNFDGSAQLYPPRTRLTFLTH